MSPKLDTTLCEKYPKIFVLRHTRSTSIGGSGFQCGDGWYDLIDRLCQILQECTDHGGGPQIVAAQVKEKFGGLRFYAHGLNDRMLGMITMAEALSHTICDVCGDRGKTVERNAVYLTRCARHENF